MRTRIFQICLCLFFALPLFAQDLLPFVENYSKFDYQGDNQTWNVAQGRDKAMYFANNHYFLRYDGVRWEKYTLPNQTIIRSIFVDGERIYSGSYKEFGYWTRRDGKMRYTSLTAKKNLFDEKENEEIWKIFKFNGVLYFQSFNEIFLFDGQKISRVKLPFQISYCFVTKGDLLLASTTQGIYRFKNGLFEKLPQYDLLENTIIHHIEQRGRQRFIFTQSRGVFIEESRHVEPWRHRLNETLKTANINTAKFLDANRLVIGTASKGIYLVDLASGNVLEIDRDNVLMNNSILSIGVDNEKDLWLGLDNGIAHIEVNSPIQIFYDSSGELGSVYSLAKTDDGYLLASNHGVFTFADGTMQLVPRSQGQAWDIEKFGDTYLIGHNTGTYLYKNGSFDALNTINGGWNFTKSGINDSFLQSTYCGVVMYHNTNDLDDKNQINGLCKPIKYAAQNTANEIWAADNYRGLYRVVYDRQYSTVSVDNITKDNNIVRDFGVKIFEFRNEILFLINNEWYSYNQIVGKLQRNDLFNKHFSGVSDIAAIDADHFLILRDGLLFLVNAGGNKFAQILIQEKYYAGKIINDNLKVFRYGDRYLINLDDGFLALSLKQPNVQPQTVCIEAYYNDELLKPEARIKYNTGLTINVVSGLFGSTKPNLFYKLNDSDFLPVRSGAIVLNNLESGVQHLTVYNYDGIRYAALGKLKFAVARPWYFSFWMILVYLLVIAGMSWLYYRWNKLRYQQKLALREEELKHQKDILELKLKSENEYNVQQYEKHILELEVQSKSSEVAGKSLSIAKQGEIFESINQILDAETDVDKLKNEIRKAIKINAVNKHEWEIFESNLNQIHNDFIIRLTAKHPQLTSKDIKLCIYLKMNLSSKEIAPLMNISFRGVELHRYRLRKKLQLHPDESLHKYMTFV